MTNAKTIVLSALILAGFSLAAVADTDHISDSDPETGSMTGMDMANDDAPMRMGSNGADMDRAAMMQMMMQMHGSMMDRGSDQMGMMDRDMMAMMMPADGPSDNIAAHMGAQLRGFDADQDGTLTLSEFEALHMSTQRDRMVDRFQHLDADADGQITPAEIEAAGTRLETMNMQDTTGHHGDDQ